MKHKITGILLFGLLFFKLSGQVDSPALYDNTIISKEDSSRLLFSFSNLNFLKNNEYFNKIATGYTFFGSHINPQIAYVPNLFMRIEGGIFVRKDFGNPHFMNIAPTLKIKLQKNGYSFLFGNLEGSVTHRLIEPLYNYERLITNRLENGLQFKIDKKAVWLDTWIDWEKQQYFHSPFQEVITAGLSSKFTLVEGGRESAFFRLKIPFQALVYHHGGQIDTISTPLLTLANTATGLSFDVDMSKKNGFLKSVIAENYYVYYHDASHSKLQHYISGTGTYLNLLLKSKYGVNLLLTYWKGDYFMAPRGGYLYQSVSSLEGSSYTEDSRQLLIARIMYQRELLPGLLADIRFEPYKDINNHFVEFSYSAYLSYKIDAPFLKKNTKN